MCPRVYEQTSQFGVAEATLCPFAHSWTPMDVDETIMAELDTQMPYITVLNCYAGSSLAGQPSRDPQPRHTGRPKQNTEAPRYENCFAFLGCISRVLIMKALPR